MPSYLEVPRTLLSPFQSLSAAYTTMTASCKVCHYIHFMKNVTLSFLQSFLSWYIRNQEKCILTLFYYKIMLLANFFHGLNSHTNHVLSLFVSSVQIGSLKSSSQDKLGYCGTVLNIPLLLSDVESSD